MNKFKIGDKVNFVVERSLLSGVITKFYKNTYNREECSIKTEIKTYPHILLRRVSKINDEDDLIKKIANLEAELAEKDELLRQKISKMKSTDFIRMCVDCGFMMEAKENDNQTAIAELIKVQKYISDNAVYLEEESFGREINDYIDNQINELKGENQ